MSSKGCHWKMSEDANGCRYLPDFHLVDLGVFIEVKGRMRPIDIVKMDAFVAAGNVLYLIGAKDVGNIRLNEATLWVTQRCGVVAKIESDLKLLEALEF